MIIINIYYKMYSIDNCLDDYTRYVLKDIENDYINASHINMNIPGSGIINQYVATQGLIYILM